MRPIQESLSNVRPITDYIASKNQVDEGLLDGLKKAKEKLKQITNKVSSWAKGIVAKLQTWWMAVDGEGNILPCSTPLTAGQAYKDGLINKKSTFVALGSQSGRVVGLNQSFDDAKKLYPTTLEWWRELSKKAVNESDEEEFKKQFTQIDEVQMQNTDPQAKYNVITTPEKLRAQVKLHVVNPAFARLMIWGAPGIGKTAILNEVVAEISREQKQDYALITKTLSNETPENFMLPKYTESGDRAEDVPKTWLPVYKPTGDPKTDKELDEKCGRGMLFIDELSRASQAVLNVILPLVNEKVFNGWKLGSGWSIICASNRDEDETSGAQTSIGNALGNRFAQVYYEPTAKSWRKWADQQGYMSPLLTQWLDMPAGETLSGGKFFYWDPNHDSESEDTTHIMCTPRSWDRAMANLAAMHETGKLEGFNIFDLDTDMMLFTLNKYVPAQAVDAFWAFLKTIQKIGDFDAAVHSAWKRNGDGLKINPKDLIAISMPLAQLIITSHKDSLPTKEEFESLANFLVKSNNEQLVSYTLDVFKNVFGAGIPDNDSTVGLKDLKSYIFFLKKLNDRKPELWSTITAFDEFMKTWGVDRKTMPDYSEGMSIIAKKYGEAFKSAAVDGKDGLG
jgi:hypothetical protein